MIGTEWLMISLRDSMHNKMLKLVRYAHWDAPQKTAPRPLAWR